MLTILRFYYNYLCQKHIYIMKKIIITGFAFAAILSSCGEAENKVEAEAAKVVTHEEVKSTSVDYANVKEGSVVNWMGSHLGGVGAHNGTVSIKEGNVLVTDGELVNADFVLDMTTIHTTDFEKGTEYYGKLIGHLSNADFFNTTEFAAAKFALTGIEAIEGDFNSKVTGNLVLLGEERSITFDANITISDVEVAIASQTFTIDRTQWGNEFNKEGTEGMSTDDIISNNITLSIVATVAVK